MFLTGTAALANPDYCAIYAEWNDYSYSLRFSPRQGAQLTWEQKALNRALIRKNYKLVDTTKDASAKIELADLNCNKKADVFGFCEAAWGSITLIDLSPGGSEQNYRAGVGTQTPNVFQFYGDMFSWNSMRAKVLGQLIEKIPVCAPL